MVATATAAEEDDGFLPRISRPVPRRPPRASAELLKAAHDGEVDLTAALLRRPDVDASASDEFGRTALHEAVRHERVEVLHQLLTALLQSLLECCESTFSSPQSLRQKIKALTKHWLQLMPA